MAAEQDQKHRRGAQDLPRIIAARCKGVPADSIDTDALWADALWADALDTAIAINQPAPT